MSTQPSQQLKGTVLVVSPYFSVEHARLRENIKRNFAVFSHNRIVFEFVAQTRTFNKSKYLAIKKTKKGMASTIVSCPLAMEWYLVPKHTSHEEYEINGFTDDPETLTEKNNPLLPR